ncbi:serine hydrolase [Rhodobacteraceae bacterium 2CG4]|uniref:Serine hydrolase n=1 Tax=Halovulum marinum TaxID=2662447 RepID=A0A6L5Z0X7_9RHOB|nr:serine hydrolase [Halovulum marinum]MSU90148.1 serine hydrolase [Halovulum marinum]
MRRWTKRLLAMVLASLLLAGGAAAWKHEQLIRLAAVNTLFDADRIVANFSAMETMFGSVALDRGRGPPSALPEGQRIALPVGAEAWAAARQVTSLLVLHDGRIVFEDYYHGTGPEDLRIAWSVSKSWLSALTGILIAEGALALDDPLERHAPALAGSAYAGVTVRDVLTMTSGVRFDEDYLDFWSDVNRMGRVLALGGSMDEFVAGLTERTGPPGRTWAYVSTDSHALAMALRGATGRSLPELMSDRLVRPLGLARAPGYLTDGHGVAFALGGLCLTTRDQARFAQMMLQEGRWQGRQIVPRDWARAATAPQAPVPDGAKGYGLQWWLPADAQDGEFLAEGVYGQYLYVDRARGVVVVMTAADRGFRGTGVDAGNIAMFRQIATAAQPISAP